MNASPARIVCEANQDRIAVPSLVLSRWSRAAAELAPPNDQRLVQEAPVGQVL